MDNAEYVVTDQAPPLVEGKRVKADDRITLTGAAASYHLRAGHVRRPDDEALPTTADGVPAVDTVAPPPAEASKKRGK